MIKHVEIFSEKKHLQNVFFLNEMKRKNLISCGTNKKIVGL